MTKGISLQNLGIVTIDPNKDYDSMYVQWAKATPSVQTILENRYGIPHWMVVNYEYWAVQNHQDANSYVKAMIAANGGSNVF